MLNYVRARHACRCIYLHLHMQVGIKIFVYEQTLIYTSVKPFAGDCASCVLPTYGDMKVIILSNQHECQTIILQWVAESNEAKVTPV